MQKKFSTDNEMNQNNIWNGVKVFSIIIIWIHYEQVLELAKSLFPGGPWFLISHNSRALTLTSNPAQSFLAMCIQDYASFVRTRSNICKDYLLALVARSIFKL